MRILAINTVYNRASTGKIAAILHADLRARGHESMVAYGRFPVDSESTYRIGWTWETYLHVMQSRLLGVTGRGSVLGTVRLKRFISAFRPEVIHLHNTHGYYVHFYQLLDHIRREKIPVIWTLHDNWPLTGQCCFFNECNKWQTGCGDCPQLRDYPRSWFLDRTHSEWKHKTEAIAALADLTLVTPSGWLADQVRHSSLRNRPVKVIYNGIDTEKTFFPRDRNAIHARLKIPEGNSVVLSVSDDFSVARKGASHVLEMARHFCGRKISVLIVGWNKSNAGLPPNVIALPPTTDQAELAAFYSAADVFCITSLSDNFPTVVLEAAACGTPVVGFDVGGIPEQLAHGIGACVPRQDDVELAKTVLAVLTAPAKFDRATCRQIALRSFDQKVMLQNYLALYKEITERTN